MTGDREIKAALERNVAAMTARPRIAAGSYSTVAELKPGLECLVQEGDYQLAIAMPQKIGGTGAGPTPGVYGRAAVASCLAVCYAMWAARFEVPISSLTVELSADFDARGEFGMDDITPGYLNMKYTVQVESEAPEEDIMKVLDAGDRYSSWRDNMTRGLPLERLVRISRPG